MSKRSGTTLARRKSNTAAKMANYANQIIREALIAEVDALALMMVRDIERRAKKAAADERRKQRKIAYRQTEVAKAKRRDYAVRWRLENPEKKAAEKRNRRAMEKSADGKHTGADILALAIAQKGRCAICKYTLEHGHHVDHVVPLAAGGGNGPDNLQLLCPPCNISKSDKDPMMFMQEQGYLI